jgi:hypothetical protein
MLLRGVPYRVGVAVVTVGVDVLVNYLANLLSAGEVRHYRVLLLVVLTIIMVVLGEYLRPGGNEKSLTTAELDSALRDITGKQRQLSLDRLGRGAISHDRPMAVLCRVGDGPPRPVEEFVEEFAKQITVPGGPAARAMVLGGAGSGKSTVTDLLVRRIIDGGAARMTPVVFRLGSWNPGTGRRGGARSSHGSLGDWLVAQLREDFPELAWHGSALYGLIEHRHVLPVLDGLDEMPESVRPAALAAIEDWLDIYGDDASLVLTYRTADQAPAGLGGILSAVPRIRLEPVTGEAAGAYLGDDHRWEPVQDQLRNPDSALAVVLSNPLMLYITQRLLPSERVATGEELDPAQLVEMCRDRDPESIKIELLRRFPRAVLDRDASLSQRRSIPAPDRAERHLRFLATQMTRSGIEELRWHTLWRLAPPPGIALPLVFGSVCGGVAFAGARVSGYPTGLWWGLAVGTGFAALLWLLGRPFTVRRPAWIASLRTGLFGGLAVGLPGGFLSGSLGSIGYAADWAGTLLVGALLGLVSGLFVHPPGPPAEDGSPTAARDPAVSLGGWVLGAFGAGVVAWVVAALVCGLPQGAEQEYADRLPGGAAFASLNAWRSALSFGLLDQLRIAVGFSLAVGAVIAAATALVRSQVGIRLLRRRVHPDGKPDYGAVARAAAVACGLAGAASGAVLAVTGGAVAGCLLGIGFGLAFGPVAMRRRRGRGGDRAESMRASLHRWVRLGLAGGLLGGMLGALAFPAPYQTIGGGWLGTAAYGAADGMQAGLALGLIAGLMFGLLPRAPGIRLANARGWFRFVAWPVLGGAVGVLMGMALVGALGTLRRSSTTDDTALGAYLLAGLALGVAAAIGSLLEERAAARYDSQLTAARITALGTTALVGAAAGIATWVVSTPTLGITAGVMLATMSLGTSPWGVFTATRLRLAAAWRLPLRLERFLRHAKDLDILRRYGTGYRFHHVQLRDALAEPLPVTSTTNISAATRPSWQSLIAGTAAAVVIIATIAAAPGPGTRDGRYAEFTAVVAKARFLGWPGEYTPFPSLQQSPILWTGYAARVTFTQFNNEPAGLNLPGSALVLVTCRGQYRVIPSGGTIAAWVPPAIRSSMQYRYLPSIQTGDPCTNEMAILVRDMRAEIFINGVFVEEIKVDRRPDRPFPPPEVWTYGPVRDEDLWSLDPVGTERTSSPAGKA